MSSVRTIQSLKNVVLFSGHMIDAPDRKTRRFPADKEPIAAEAIATRSQQLEPHEAILRFVAGHAVGTYCSLKPPSLAAWTWNSSFPSKNLPS